MKFILSLTLAALLASGCATNPMTGRSQLRLVSEQSAIAQSTSAYDAMIGDLQKKHKLATDPELIARVKGIADRLIQEAVRYRPDAASWQWRIEVIDEPKTVNAFCMAGGRMAVYTGLIEKVAPTDDELAQVIGHEISHAIAGHSAEKMSVQMASNLGVLLVAAAVGDNQRQAVTNLGALGALAFINLPNSREAETEADKLGIELAARAGYLPQAAASLWEKMIKATGNKSGSDFLSTHPAPPKRIDNLRALEQPMMAFYDAARNNPPARAWTSLNANEKTPGEAPVSSGPAEKFYAPKKP